MKKSLYKDSLREIKKTIKRFLSILVMAFLGVGFYAGIRATSVDMIDTLDTYYKDNKMYDFELISTFGLTEEDITSFNSLAEIETVEGSFSKDMLVHLENQDVVSKIHSITNLNSLNIKEGRLPQNTKECVVEYDFLEENSFHIGDTITLESNGFLESDSLQIVGVVESPLYISIERGSSNLGTGTIDYFIYVNKESIESEYYTEMYLTLKKSNDYKVNSKSYEEYIEEVKIKIEEAKNERIEAQYLALENKVKEEVNKTYQNMGLPIENIDYTEYLKDIEKPTWYIYNRTDNLGYAGFIRDTESIENIGKVFPAVFFIIATLISLTSMTRMVEEERVQIGTLKGLGYKKLEIASKYIIYASFATLIGGILGMMIGFQLIPKLIWKMYEALYSMPHILCRFNLYFGGFGLAMAYLCITGASLLAVISELKSVPANLMRPKAPKHGKRIFLEYIPIIWKRLSFTWKVTLRNLFRYKKRFFMTIIGIAGCSALILAGFGLKDAVSDILVNQYDKLFLYDMQILLNENDQNKVNELIEYLNNKEEIKDIAAINISTIDLKYQDIEKETYFIVVENKEDLAKMIKMQNNKTKKEIELKENEIVITSKVAEILKVKKGDEIILKDKEGQERKIIIHDIMENYVYHYAYITKETYENLFQEEYHTNAIYLKNKNLTSTEEQTLAESLLQKENILSITLTTNLKTKMDDTLNSLNYIIWILIISAGLLALAVLYNLSNVNISERIRELATIKVLGFYDYEVYQYVTRETILLMLIGIPLGILGGVFLTKYITYVAEIDIFRFGTEIHWLSYIYAIVLTVVFHIIVNIFTYFTLRKINMIESLKSVE